MTDTRPPPAWIAWFIATGLISLMVWLIQRATSHWPGTVGVVLALCFLRLIKYLEPLIR